MTLGAVAFAALVWGSLVSVVVTFGYLLWVVFREGGTGRETADTGRGVDR